jgi:hypothetical protein
LRTSHRSWRKWLVEGAGVRASVVTFLVAVRGSFVSTSWRALSNSGTSAPPFSHASDVPAQRTSLGNPWVRCPGDRAGGNRSGRPGPAPRVGGQASGSLEGIHRGGSGRSGDHDGDRRVPVEARAPDPDLPGLPQPGEHPSDRAFSSSARLRRVPRPETGAGIGSKRPEPPPRTAQGRGARPGRAAAVSAMPRLRRARFARHHRNPGPSGTRGRQTPARLLGMSPRGRARHQDRPLGVRPLPFETGGAAPGEFAHSLHLLPRLLGHDHGPQPGALHRLPPVPRRAPRYRSYRSSHPGRRRHRRRPGPRQRARMRPLSQPASSRSGAASRGPQLRPLPRQGGPVAGHRTRPSAP